MVEQVHRQMEAALILMDKQELCVHHLPCLLFRIFSTFKEVGRFNYITAPVSRQASSNFAETNIEFDEGSR